MAWLRAYPDGSRESRLESFSRLDMSIDYPKIQGLEFLINYLHEFGYCATLDSRYIPITFAELYSWTQGTRRKLNRWTFVLLRKLSKDYSDQANISANKYCPSPYMEELYESHRKDVLAAKIKAQF